MCMVKQLLCMQHKMDIKKYVDLLIKAGADVNITDNDSNTALIVAACGDYDASVKKLISAGANVNIQNHDRRIALMRASSNGHDGCIKLLIGAGADVNILDSDENSVLHHLSYCHQDLSQCAGANVNVINKKGKTVVECVRNLNLHKETLKLLSAAGENVHKPMGEAAKYNLPESELHLNDLCRKAIRKHLLNMNHHENLLVRVPKLGLPATLQRYLVYGLSLEKRMTRGLERE